MAGVPAKKNTAFTFWTALTLQSDTKLLKANPTLAAGDVKVSKDGGAFANLGTLPDAEPDSGYAIRVQLTSDEMNADMVCVQFVDAAGAEWCDQMIIIQTAAGQVGDAATLADDAITSAKFDESTAYPLKAADSGNTYIARTGADSDTLETLSDQIDGITLTAAAIADAVWDEALAGHLSAGSTGAALNSVTTSTGSSSVTITVDDGTDPVPDVDVEVWNEGETAFITWSTTDVNGQAVFSLDDATYSMRLRKAGYSFTVPETLVVSGDTEETFSGETVNIGVPASSEACRVYEYCFAQDGVTPLTSLTTATAEIYTLPYDAADKLHAKTAVTGTYSSVTGLVYWDIAQGATVWFKLPQLMDEAGLLKLVPATATARLVELTTVEA